MDYILTFHCKDCCLFKFFEKSHYGICLDNGKSLVVHRDDNCHDDIGLIYLQTAD